MFNAWGTVTLDGSGSGGPWGVTSPRGGGAPTETVRLSPERHRFCRHQHPCRTVRVVAFPQRETSPQLIRGPPGSLDGLWAWVSCRAWFSFGKSHLNSNAANTGIDEAVPNVVEGIIAVGGKERRVCQHIQTGIWVISERVAIDAYTWPGVETKVTHRGHDLRKRIAAFVVARGELLRLHEDGCAAGPTTKAPVEVWPVLLMKVVSVCP